MLLLRTITSSLLQTNCYLLTDDQSKQAILIDAPYGIADEVASELHKQQATLTTTILTHGHFDHSIDAPIIKQRFGSPILMHRDDALFVTTPDSQRIPFAVLGINVDPFEPDEYLDTSQLICLGNTEYQIITTPGHTPGGICLYSAGENRLFSGDTLFAGTYGRTDYAGGNDRALRLSLMRLSELPANTVFYPGHGQSSTIGAERWLAQITV